MSKTAAKTSTPPANPVDTFWTIRLATTKEALEANNFEVSMAENLADAARIFLEDILPASGAKSVSFGGSMSVGKSGVPEALRAMDAVELLDTMNYKLPAAEMYELRRQALLVDLFLSSTNALTVDGKLVNLDMIGNRVGGINFGPKKVVLFVGRNKVVDSVEDGMRRIKEFSAPTNAIRLAKKTPCVKVAECMDCKSPDRICNVWTITEKAFPAKRIHVILINEDTGL